MLRLFPLYPHSYRNFLRECPRRSNLQPQMGPIGPLALPM